MLRALPFLALAACLAAQPSRATGGAPRLAVESEPATTDVGSGTRADDPEPGAPSAVDEGSVSIADPGAAMAALERLVAERRKTANRAPLRVDPLLTDAAQRHAEDLLAAVEKGEGPEAVATLSDVITDLERSRKFAAIPTRSYDAFQRHEIAAQAGDRRGNVAGLESVLVVDAASAGAALQAIEGTPGRVDLLESAFGSIGIGLAVSSADGSGRIVWVVALRRR